MPNPPHLPNRERRRVGWLLLVAASALAVPARGQTAFDLPQLMRALARVRSGSATFTERRTVAMLDRTLDYSGTLAFEAPGTFVRETLKPRRERVAVNGNTVTMSLGARSKTVQLDSVPEAAVIMEAIRGTLTGNREALERNFTAVVDGSAQRWTLELKPRQARLAELVISVRMAGEASDVRQVTVAMADGDRSVMTIDPLVPGPLPRLSPDPVSAASRPAS